MSAAVHTRDKLTVRQAGGAAGAYVTGLDLSRRLEGEDVASLRQALLDHLVVALPDQKMSLDDLERITDQLGGRDVTPFVTPMEGRPYVIRIVKEADEKLNFANAWHTDLSYLPAPPSFTLLYCLEAPPYGGDTIWANQYLAYARLPAELRETLLGLKAVHSAGAAYGDGGYLDGVKHLMSTPDRALGRSPKRADPCGGPGPRRDWPPGALRQSGLYLRDCRLEQDRLRRACCSASIAIP